MTIKIKRNEIQRAQQIGSIVEDGEDKIYSDLERIIKQNKQISFSTTPVYYGLHQFGTMSYDGVEQKRPLRPWRKDFTYSIINTDAGTSSNITFEDDEGSYLIKITGESFDCRILDVGDEIEVSDTDGETNDGTYTIVSLEDDEIEVAEAVTNQGPISATIEVNGSNIDRQGTNLDGYTFGDTSENPANRLNWHLFGDVVFGKPKIIAISDKILVANCSWNHINGSDYIFGKNQSIDGVEFLVRSLTGGDRNRDGDGQFSYAGGSLPNEWDRYVMNGIDQELGPFFDNAINPENSDYLSGSQSNNNTARRREHNQLWNWIDMYTWCQETIFDDASRCCIRGHHSARHWYHRSVGSESVFSGFRPVLLLP